MSALDTYNFYKDSDDPLFGGASEESIQAYYDDIAGLTQDEIEQKNISLIGSGGVGSSYSGSSGGGGGTGGLGQSAAAFDRDTALQIQALIGDQNLALQSLKNEGAIALGQISGAASMYGSDQDTIQQQIASAADQAARQYDSFMKSMSATNIQAIKSASDISIKEIDKASRDSVANITGSWAAQNTELQGAYTNENARIAGQYSKDVAKMNKDASLFSSLFSGFW